MGSSLRLRAFAVDRHDLLALPERASDGLHIEVGYHDGFFRKDSS